MIALVVAVVLVGFLVARRRRKDTLAGLNVERPMVSLAPPRRFSASGKAHRL